VALIILLFSFPLQLLAAIFALLARDTPAATLQRTILPVGRQKRSRAAMNQDLDAQLATLGNEAGVRTAL